MYVTVILEIRLQQALSVCKPYYKSMFSLSICLDEWYQKNFQSFYKIDLPKYASMVVCDSNLRQVTNLCAPESAGPADRFSV